MCSGGHSPLAQVLVGYTKLLPNFQDTIWTWCFIELGIWHLRIPVLSFSTGSPTTFITRLSSITENVDFITTLSCYFGTFSIKINPLKSWRWRGKAVRQIVRKIFFHWIFSLVFFLSPPLLHCMYGLDILIFLQKSFCIVCLYLIYLYLIYLCLRFYFHHQNCFSAKWRLWLVYNWCVFGPRLVCCRQKCLVQCSCSVDRDTCAN